MKYYSFSIIGFFIFFIFFPSKHLEFTPNVIDSWIWDKEGGYGTKSLDDLENALTVLNGYKSNKSFYSFSSKQFLTIPEDSLITYSIFDKGYYEYKKLGDLVSYFNENQEMFWQKNYSSYPRPGYFSTVIPLVSGDGNIIFLADKNGNPKGIGEVKGRFATDIAYSYYTDHMILLFSGGEFFLIDDNGNILTKHRESDIEHTETYFAKSVAISGNGQYFAIHHQKGELDTISVFFIDGELEYAKVLPEIVPHKLNMALADDGSLIYPQQNKFIILDNDGDVNQSIQNDSSKGIYQSILAKDELIFIKSGNYIKILDSNGIIIREIFLASNFNPMRFLPGKNPGTFYIETSKDIRQIIIRK